MSSTVSHRIAFPLPPDQEAREQALDRSRSVLVQAPAGSGKTDLLTRRFLGLLGEVDEPEQIVAITFTKAAAAEMRHRILAELEKAAARETCEDFEALSMEALAARALSRSQAREWNLIELPARLRVTTIDAFCREIALNQPLLSELGGGLDIAAQPGELYRRAARRTLEQIDAAQPELRESIAALLLWRDNGWQEMESLLIEMLKQRDRWMQGFLLTGEQDWEALRERLERPFARAVQEKMVMLSALLDQVPRARAEALELARIGCEQSAGALYRELAEMAEFPCAPFEDAEQIEEVRQACACLARLLQTQKSAWRSEKGLNATAGFPATDSGRAAKKRLVALIADLRQIPGLEAALAAVANLPPARYSEDDWHIVRACFTLLRRAAAQLQVVFAEQGAVDYTEVTQIALRVLAGDDGAPSDAALAAADNIRHLLVDEFQDTSRRQHQLLTSLIAAWPEREGRTCFVVGDPMQSIYSFRDADVELFSRVRSCGFEIPGDTPFPVHPARLKANFRAARGLVKNANEIFAKVFSEDDGSGIAFEASEPARQQASASGLQLAEETIRLQLHIGFMLQTPWSGSLEEKQRIAGEREAVQRDHVKQIIAVIRGHEPRMEVARAEGRPYRIAVLGRTRKALAAVAAGLRAAGIPFAAVDLEELRERPEVTDALALARALLNPQDRVAWLGVLRAPWCGLSLADLHTLVSADDPEIKARPVPLLLAERRHLLSPEASADVERVLGAIEAADGLRANQPAATLGAWMEQVWLRLGGDACADAAARANLRLLWKCFDSLPEGEQDIPGPALDLALEKLTAMPDPQVESNHGVQLMTIHKAKGLEFEVVIVPELQAGAGRTHAELLSWMERGLAESDGSGEATEFLVAPIQPKGGERGEAKSWVVRIRRERESQEMRRLLYVAMTRAREELNLFARLNYKMANDGLFELIPPKDCLLAAAWPALEEEIRGEFDEWRESSAPATIETLAAGEASVSPLLAPAVLRRLPPDFKVDCNGPALEPRGAIPNGGADGPLFRRHEGGLESRALGIAVHSLLEELARLRRSRDWPAAIAALAELQPRIAAEARSSGLERGQAGRIAAQALEIARNVSRDPLGQWILSPHEEAASEARWTGIVDDGVRSVRVDRVFRAGALPGAGGSPESGSAGSVAGDETWWIIDYKTAHAEGLDPEKALPELRELFQPQLEAYARVLRALNGENARVRAGLYYPRMNRFDWWEA